MLKALIRVNLASILNWLTGGKKRSAEKSSGKGKLILYSLLMLYAFGVFAWLFAQIFGLLAAPLYAAGSGWLYYDYVFIMCFALMFIFSVFAAKNRLYEAKDNDLLLSMPIPPAYILASRMSLLFVLNFFAGILVAGPAVYMWFKSAPFDALSLVFIILLFLCLCFFSMALSSLFGWLLSAVSSRMRKKALFETLFSLAFLALYLYEYSRINEIVQNLIANNAQIAESMGSVAPLYWLGAGAVGEAVPFLLGIALLIVPFAAVYYLLSRTFIKTATAKRGNQKVKYEAKAQKASSASKALLNREFKRFFSSSVCIMNNGLGAIFLIIGAAALLIYKNQIGEFLVMTGMPVEIVLCAFVLMIMLLAGMVQPTSCSVSLEGKSIWVVQSMPVRPSAVLLAKLKLSYIMYLPPTLLCTLAAIYVLSPPPEIAGLAVAAALSAVIVMGQIGLICNVNHPSLNWTTETQAVKSGVAVLISMLIDFGMTAAVGIVGYLLLKRGVSVEILLMAAFIIFLLTARVLYTHIAGKSAAKFAKL